MHWHVDEAFAEDEADVILRFKAGGAEQALEGCVERRVRGRLGEGVCDERLDGRVTLNTDR